jgi:hypothetical protein
VKSIFGKCAKFAAAQTPLPLPERMEKYRIGARSSVRQPNPTAVLIERAAVFPNVLYPSHPKRTPAEAGVFNQINTPVRYANSANYGLVGLDVVTVGLGAGTVALAEGTVGLYVNTKSDGVPLVPPPLPSNSFG